MSVRKKDQAWIVDVRPQGTHGKRVIRKFPTNTTPSDRVISLQAEHTSPEL